MNPDIRRWQLLALLLFLLLSISACRQPLPAVTDTPSPAPESGSAEAGSTPTVAIVSSATPLPTINYKGVEFAFDEQVLGPLGATSHRAPVAPGKGRVQPERLEISLNAENKTSAPILYVFPVEQYEALSEDAAAEITLLRDLLVARPAEVTGELPFLPMYQAVASYHSDPTYLDFKNGSGVSYMARVDHDHSLATDETFFYTFQGLTDDGQFYVATLIPLTEIDPDWQEDAPADTQASEASERTAKAAVDNGEWIGAGLEDGRSLIDDIMLSLQVAPDESFPSIALPNFATAQGLFMAYDSQLSGDVTMEHGPAIVGSPQGDITFLHGAPDMLTVHFRSTDKDVSGAQLQIQPLRNEENEFYETIPEWQQDEALALEQSDLATVGRSLNEGAVSDLQYTAFQNGSGVRGLITRDAGQGGDIDDDNAQVDYFFKGVSEDGRYLIRLQHPLPPELAKQEAVGYLDDVMASLLVDSDASTSSSIPLNAADCENDAEFVEDVSIPDYTVVERGDISVKIWRVRNSGTCTWTPAYQVLYAQGNPVEWQPMAITAIVPPGEEAEVGITVQSPAIPGFYQAWWQLGDEQSQPFGDELGILFEAPKPATDIPGYGVIEGEINYPANGNPAVDIYFQKIDSSERYVMSTERGWTQYSNAIPVGSYHVFARVSGDTSDSGGGYTEAVICGLHTDCNDHSLVEVVVEEGRAARNANLFDWYAPAGSFPLPEPVAKPENAPSGD